MPYKILVPEIMVLAHQGIPERLEGGVAYDLQPHRGKGLQGAAKGLRSERGWPKRWLRFRYHGDRIKIFTGHRAHKSSVAKSHVLPRQIRISKSESPSHRPTQSHHTRYHLFCLLKKFIAVVLLEFDYGLFHA